MSETYKNQLRNPETGESNLELCDKGSEPTEKTTKLPLSSIGVKSTRTIATQTKPVLMTPLPLSEQYWPDFLIHPDLWDTEDEPEVLKSGPIDVEQAIQSDLDDISIETMAEQITNVTITNQPQVQQQVPLIQTSYDGNSIKIQMTTTEIKKIANDVEKESQSSQSSSTSDDGNYADIESDDNIIDIACGGMNLSDKQKTNSIAEYLELRKEFEAEKVKMKELVESVTDDKNLFSHADAEYNLWLEINENLKIQETILSEITTEKNHPKISDNDSP